MHTKLINHSKAVEKKLIIDIWVEDNIFNFNFLNDIIWPPRDYNLSPCPFIPVTEMENKQI